METVAQRIRREQLEWLHSRFKSHALDDPTLAGSFMIDVGIHPIHSSVDQWLQWLGSPPAPGRHCSRTAPSVAEAVCCVTRGRPLTAAQIADALGWSRSKAANAATNLAKAGRLARHGNRGRYRYEAAA